MRIKKGDFENLVGRSGYFESQELGLSRVHCSHFFLLFFATVYRSIFHKNGSGSYSFKRLQRRIRSDEN